MNKVFAGAFIFSLFCSAFSGAEGFRVRTVHPIELSGNVIEEKTVSVGINDAVAILMPEDTSYLEGFDLKVQIPAIVADWRDSVAFSVYDGIKPRPSSSQIDYSGTRVFVVPLPPKLNWIVQVPLKAQNSMKDSNYVTKLNVIPDVSGGYTFLRFQPAMKGVPDETYEAVLQVTVKPVLMNKGTLALSVQAAGKTVSQYDFFVDDKPCVLKNGKILLDSGKHSISVQAEDFRNEVRSVYVEQAKTTALAISLKSLAPTLTVTAPENAQVFLDGQRFVSLGKEVVVTEGEHILKCLIGGYEMVRSLSVEKGKSYIANLTVDLEISEE